MRVHACVCVCVCACVLGYVLLVSLEVWVVERVARQTFYY